MGRVVQAHDDLPVTSATGVVSSIEVTRNKQRGKFLLQQTTPEI
jgi:hypothetical protein